MITIRMNNMDFMLLYLSLAFITFYSMVSHLKIPTWQRNGWKILTLEFEIPLEYMHRVLYVIIENLARNTCASETSNHYKVLSVYILTLVS